MSNGVGGIRPGSGSTSKASETSPPETEELMTFSKGNIWVDPKINASLLSETIGKLIDQKLISIMGQEAGAAANDPQLIDSFLRACQGSVNTARGSYNTKKFPIDTAASLANVRVKVHNRHTLRTRLIELTTPKSLADELEEMR
ncbi:MAG: hypothetical protein ABIH50_04735 [bacterium]